MSESRWVAQADQFAEDIFRALSGEESERAERQFAELMALTQDWCRGEAKGHCFGLDETEDIIAETQTRFWKFLCSQQEQGKRIESVLASLKTIIGRIAIDRLRQDKRNYQRVQNNLGLILEKSKHFAQWTDRGEEWAGRTEWKRSRLNDAPDLSNWHRERIRLKWEESLSEKSRSNLGERIVVLLVALFNVYPYPVRVKDCESLCMELLDLKAMTVISLETPIASGSSDATLKSVLPSQEAPIASSVVQRVTFPELLQAIKGVLSAMSVYTREALLLRFETDTLTLYCEPDSPESVLTPLHEEAFALPASEALAMARQDLERVPIPDEEIARRMKMEKGGLQVLRHRARKRLESTLGVRLEEWLAP